MSKAFYLVVLGITLVLFRVSTQNNKVLVEAIFPRTTSPIQKKSSHPTYHGPQNFRRVRLRGSFIPSIQYGRDMVELMQRLQLDPTTDSIDRSWDISCWGIGDYYGHEYRGDRDDFQTVYGYVEKGSYGSAQYEVMLIPGLNGWSRMTRATRDAILRRVQDGAGLVLLHPFVGDVKGHPFKGDETVGDQRIWEISPLLESRTTL
jgi:hypothetical protein